MEQVGSPVEIYRRPRTRYVGEFVGTINLLPGTVTAAGDLATVATALGDVRVATEVATELGDRVTILCRPEALRITDERPAAAVKAWRGTVRTVVFAGSYFEHLMQLGDGREVKAWIAEESAAEGSTSWLSVPPAGLELVRDEPSEESA